MTERALRDSLNSRAPADPTTRKARVRRCTERAADLCFWLPVSCCQPDILLIRSGVVEFFRHVLGAQERSAKDDRGMVKSRVCGCIYARGMLFDRDADTTGLIYGLAIVVTSFFISLWTMNYISPPCPQEAVTLKGNFIKQGALSFYAAVPPMSSLSDTVEAPKRSPFLVCENNRVLGPAHSSHGEIATKGGGRFSHAGQGFYFSSSDNSDPNTNGRTYLIVRPP
jgi:hypothetical protein